MKKILFALIIFITACFVINTPRKDQRNFKDIFREEMNYAEFKTYINPDMGYGFQYPSFFSQENSDDGTCCVRFGYHANDINMVLELRIIYVRSLSNVYKESISSGKLNSYTGYCYHSHNIVYRHRRYVLTFFYPQDYKHAVTRIIRNLNEWKPFKYCKKIF